MILNMLVKGAKFAVLLQVVFSLMIFLLQESLKKVLQEKLEAIQRLTEIEVCWFFSYFCMVSSFKHQNPGDHLNWFIFILYIFFLAMEQKSCNNAEDDCQHYKSLYERSQQELTDLAEKHKQVMNNVFSLYMYNRLSSQLSTVILNPGSDQLRGCFMLLLLLFDCDNRRIETHQLLLITSLHSQ